MSRPSKKTELLILLILLCAYLVLATKDITLPGVSFDEVFTACGTINLLKNKETNYHAVATRLFGRLFPIMFTDYHPSLESYLLIPFFLLFGINVFSLRITPIFFGLLTLIFTYLFAKDFFNRRVALITVLLLVTSPYFISITKLGNYFHSSSIFFFVTALFCLLRWYRGVNITYFVLGAFLLGLGSSTVGWFIIVVITLLVLAIIFGKDIKKRIQKDNFKSLWLYFILGIVFFCLGDFLFIYANFINESSRFTTFKYLLSHLRDTREGVDNLSYLENLGLRLKNLLDILRENNIINSIFSYNKSKGNNFYSFAFFIILVWLTLSLLFEKKMFFRKKKTIFLLGFIGIMFVISPFTISCFKSWHISTLIPFIKITISVGMIELSQLFRKRSFRRISQGILSIFILLILIVPNLKILKDYYMDLRKIGGKDEWSDAIYELVEWLKETKPSNILALNFGFSFAPYFLMQGEKYIQCYHCSSSMGGSNEEECVNGFVRLFRDKNTMYFVNIHRLNFIGDKDVLSFFKRAVNIAGKILIEEKVFYQRDRSIGYIVYSVR